MKISKFFFLIVFKRNESIINFLNNTFNILILMALFHYLTDFILMGIQLEKSLNPESIRDNDLLSDS